VKPECKNQRPPAVILTDPEEMRKARYDQPSVTSEEFKRQMERMLEQDRGMREFLNNREDSSIGQPERVV